MAKKRDTELEIVDTPKGVAIKSGKQAIAEINEEFGTFVVVMGEKEVAVVRTFAEAVDEAVKAYNLSL